MKTVLKLMVAALTLSTALSATAGTFAPVVGLGDSDQISRACYDAYGRIVPCKRAKPKY